MYIEGWRKSGGKLNQEKKKDPNDMDIGAVGRFEHKNQFDEIKEEEDMCQICNDTMEGLYRQVF